MPQPKKSGGSARRTAARKPASRSRSSSSSRPTAKSSARKSAARKPAARKTATTRSASTTRKSSTARKPAARKTAARKTAARKPAARSADGNLAAVRELLARGVVLTGDRLQETMDEAVKRGRMTRADADRLVQSLIQTGRKQTQDLLAELEALVERGRSSVDRSAGQTRKRTRSRVKSVATAARRTPGTDRALQQVDKARRAAKVGSSFPVIGYDDLTAAQIAARLTDLKPAELRKVRDHERRNANRKSVLGSIEKKLG